MKAYGGYKPGTNSNYNYPSCLPEPQIPYQIPPSSTSYLPPYRENKLVGHIYETIARRNINGSIADGIEALFNDRLGLIRSKIELILLLLDQRKEIKEKVLYKIDEDSCRAQNLIFEMGHRAYRVERDRLTLERIKLDLEQQKRMELVNYFRDTGMLNMDLKDALIQYLGETQKSSIINMEGRK
jgi:hypothetical protein